MRKLEGHTNESAKFKVVTSNTSWFTDARKLKAQISVSQVKFLFNPDRLVVVMHSGVRAPLCGALRPHRNSKKTPYGFSGITSKLQDGSLVYLTCIEYFKPELKQKELIGVQTSGCAETHGTLVLLNSHRNVEVRFFVKIKSTSIISPFPKTRTFGSQPTATARQKFGCEPERFTASSSLCLIDRPCVSR
jgi:hypothetical protein